MAGRTYRFFTGQPWYGFGYGLSYSSFRYSGLEVKRSAAGNGDLRVSARVKNDSARDGDEVVQLYVRAEGADSVLAELKGFERVHINAGQDRTVEFALGAEQIGNARSITVSVGGGQPGSGTQFVQTSARMR